MTDASARIAASRAIALPKPFAMLALACTIPARNLPRIPPGRPRLVMGLQKVAPLFKEVAAG